MAASEWTYAFTGSEDLADAYVCGHVKEGDFFSTIAGEGNSGPSSCEMLERHGKQHSYNVPAQVFL